MRPIASGETFRRLVAKVACKLAQHTVVPKLVPVQVGCSVPLGVEQVIHTLRHVLCSTVSEKRFVLQVDISNAFNTISRESIVRTVSSFCPFLTPWVSYCLAPSPPLVHGSNDFSQMKGYSRVIRWGPCSTLLPPMKLPGGP